MPPKKKKGDEPERMPLLGRATNNVGIGIVGLLIPNVGKSTFFNTLSKLHVPAENYPFCTVQRKNQIWQRFQYQIRFKV